MVGDCGGESGASSATPYKYLFICLPALDRSRPRAAEGAGVSSVSDLHVGHDDGGDGVGLDVLARASPDGHLLLLAHSMLCSEWETAAEKPAFLMPI